MRAGEPWGEPLGDGELVIDVTGDDADLARAARTHPGAVIRFTPAPSSDLARALGLGPGGPAAPGTVVACDLVDLAQGRTAANLIVLGVAPDRVRRRHRLHPVTVEIDGRQLTDAAATSVVVATGQFLRGADLVPRGHPGDGRLEVQVYSVSPGERRALRRRLATGQHVPHPGILQASGRRVSVRWGSEDQDLEVDGRPWGTAGGVEARIDPGALRVLI